ncbi:ribonuclease E/G [Lichenicola sp.]|uniref:ribonuclease E/G n=1 Tax=Lichenicola sp. TaxID=2804529 RepID=UPI003AFFBC62
MSVRLLVACSPGEIRIAVAGDGGPDAPALTDYALWRPGAPDGVGDLHRGRVEAVVPALGGAFVALAPDRQVSGAVSGFLPMRDGDLPAEGDAVLVRVVRAAQGGKGPRLVRVSPSPGVPSPAGAPALLERGPDPLTRLAASWPDAQIIADDPSLGPDLVPALRPRIRVESQAIPADLESLIDALSEPDVALPGGMRASIHPTPALVAIDLDGAATTASRQSKQTAQFAANRAAIGPLLHQLRLRNLSGAILIDLAGLASRKRAALRPEIEAALARDPLQPRLLGFTALGLAEILRPRLHPPLHELLGTPHAAGLAALREAARVAGSPPHRLPRLVASPLVTAALERDPLAAEALARRVGQPISIQTDPSFPPLAWKLEHG